MERIARFGREEFLGFFGLFGRRPPIRDAQELAEFIDRQSAFITQKGIYEYSRARAGHYAKVMFNEPEFVAAVEQSRWRAFPIGLAMVAEVVEGVLRPHCGGDRQQFDALCAIVLSVFDHYPIPAALGGPTWSAKRFELERRLQSISLHPPKRVIDISGAVRAGLFRSVADTRKAAPERLSDHVQLSQGDALQHS